MSGGSGFLLLALEEEVQLVVGGVVVAQRHHDPDGVEEDEHEPEVLECQVAVKPGRPVLYHNIQPGTGQKSLEVLLLHLHPLHCIALLNRADNMRITLSLLQLNLRVTNRAR